MQNYTGLNINRYSILSQLGQGGMAVVYRAFDTELNRDVAIKILRSESFPQEQQEMIIRRFYREAEALEKLKHPNIVPLYDHGEFEGVPYLVMAYLPGSTLKQRTGQRMAWQEALHLLTPIAAALTYAHNQGLIHRDIKPSNILISSDGSPILTDFGIAKMMESDATVLTSTNMGIGTPEYMAPEQWQGKACPASDQYSLGVVLYELITGVKPYSADTPFAVALKQISEPVRPPSELAAGIPVWLEAFLIRALARYPQDRFSNMSAMFRAMQEHQHRPISQPVPVPRSYTPSKDPTYATVAPVDQTNEMTRDENPQPYWGSNQDSLTRDENYLPYAGNNFSNNIPYTSKSSNKRSVWHYAWIGGAVLLLLIASAFVVNWWLEIRVPPTMPSTEAPGADEGNNDSEDPLSAWQTQLSGAVSGTATRLAAQSPKNPTPAPQITNPSPTRQDPTPTATVTPKKSSPTPTATVYKTPTPVRFSFSGCSHTYLRVGYSAFISYEGGKNKLRDTASTIPSDNIIGEIQPGEVVEIIGGPQCELDRWVLWKVRTTRNEVGWTPETDGDEYWVLPIATRQFCSGTLPSRLIAGKQALVQEYPPQPNRVREDPSTSGEVLGYIKTGEKMWVLEGPRCGEGANWWKVQAVNGGLVGWTMESLDDEYYLAPIP